MPTLRFFSLTSPTTASGFGPRLRALVRTSLMLSKLSSLMRNGLQSNLKDIEILGYEVEVKCGLVCQIKNSCAWGIEVTWLPPILLGHFNNGS